MPVSLESEVVQSQDLVVSELDGYTMLMSIEEGKFYSISPVGTRIWQHLEQPCRLAAVGEALKAEFDVPVERCHAELLAFVTRLAEERLVQVRP